MLSAILVVVDGLRPEYLGCYGNSWVSTPNWNRLAAEGFVFDHCLAAEQDPVKAFRSLLAGRHPAFFSREVRSDTIADGGGVLMTAPLIQSVERNGGSSLLVTDDPRFFQDPSAQWFETVQLVSGRRVETPATDSWEAILAGLPPTPCADWAETWTAGFFSQASDLLTGLKDRPFFLCCHLGGFSRIWDCPMEFRERYQEEGDPPPWNGVSAPRHFFPPGADPDSWLPFVQTYAGQVVLLDLCLGGLLQAISMSGLDERCVLALTGLGGYPLAEHGWLGLWKMVPRNERVGCPLVLRFPDRVGASDRSHALCYLHDLAPTLNEAVGNSNVSSDPRGESSGQTGGANAVTVVAESAIAPVRDADGTSLMPIIRGEAEQVRERLFCCCDDPAATAIRTASWFAVVDMSADLQAFDRGPMEAASESARPTATAFADPCAESVSTHPIDQGAAAPDLERMLDLATVRRIVELYVKPHDRWEMNDVADRCPEAAAAAIRQTLAFRRLVNGELSTMPPLDPELTERLS
ncbi:sulfatase-like hydrolase/transferase [Thermopirellula anaerolimosa]